MATPKKGQGIQFKLPGEDVSPKPEPAPTEPAPVDPITGRKTGLGVLMGMMAEIQSDGSVGKLQTEIESLKKQVGEQLLDPNEIGLTRWADRHIDSFSTPDFEELKKDIASAGGNIQPIKVRLLRDDQVQAAGIKYELIYGSRRRRACQELGLPVGAVVQPHIDDQTLYVQMQRENRGRLNLSAWEQGASYFKALSEGLFSSARNLAEQIGVDHSNVSKALKIAQLPTELVGAFHSPIEIQFRWATALHEAFERSPHEMKAAARAVSSESPRPGAKQIFDRLMQAARKERKGPRPGKPRELVLANGRKCSIAPEKNGSITVKLPRGTVHSDHMEAFESGLLVLLARLAESRQA